MILKIRLLILLLAISFMPHAWASPNDFYTTVAPSEVQFQVIDPIGNMTGYNPLLNTVVNTIPNTEYVSEVSTTGDEEPTKNDMYHQIHPTLIMDNIFITTGTYKIKLFGASNIETFRLEFLAFYQGFRGAQIKSRISTRIYPNVTWIYEITVPDVPPATKNVLLVKVANPQDLIIDINAAGSLGYIGSSKFVSELTKEINEIEAEKAKGKVDDGLTPAQKAKKEYTELLKEITEKYNKPEGDEFVKKEAYDVLREDLEYIINHL